MKKEIVTQLRFFTLILISTFLCTVTVYAQKTTIKVGYQPNYGIIEVPTIRGAEGFGYEYFHEIEKHTNYTFKLIPAEFAEGLELLKKGEIDLFAPASMTEERKDSYSFVETPFCFESANIYALKEHNYYFNDPAALKGLTLGIREGSSYEETITGYCKEHKINLKTLKNPDFELALKNKRDLYSRLPCGFTSSKL